MKRPHPMPFIILLLTLITNGCVSQQSFQSVVQQLERERVRNEQLQKQLDQIKAAADRLKADSDKAARENETLIKEAGENTARMDELSAKIESRAREMDALLKKKGVVTVKKPDMVWAKGLSDALQKSFHDEIRKGDVSVKQTSDRLILTLSESILFDPDDVEISKEGEDVMIRLGEVLKTVKGQQILVGSHLDDMPIAPSMAREFPTSWDFTGVRAVALVRFLHEESQISGKILTAAAYGSYRAVASNTTDSGRVQNRRIEIVLSP